MVGVTTHVVQSGPRTGWISWSYEDFRGFMRLVGPSYARPAGDGRAQVAIATRDEHGNIAGGLHGGLLAGFADHAYFAALAALGRTDQVGGVTTDLTMQYLAAGAVGPDLEAEVEILRETGRMLFMRLLLRQDGETICASSATIRKPSR